MSTIFITGANGFIGKALVEYLAKNSENTIYALIRPNTLPRFLLKENIRVVYGDVTDKKSIQNTLPHNAFIVNLAANPYHKTLSYEVNVNGMKNIINVAKQKNVQKLIHISSQATKIKQKGVYARTKERADNLITNSKLNYVILKPSLVYGDDERGLFNKVATLIKTLPVVPVFGNGKTKVNPISVHDLCLVVEQVLQDEKASKLVFDVGSADSTSYDDVYRFIMKRTGVIKPILHIPKWVGIIAARILSILPHPPLYEDNILGSTQETNCDSRPLFKQYPQLHFETFGRENNNVRVAIVGLGKMGMLHASILTSFADVNIVALIDTNKQLFTTIKSMGISGTFFTSLRNAYEKLDIDAVYVITPTFTHTAILDGALNNGSAVFIEKPVVLNETELENLKKRMLNTKLPVHVGYTLLFNRVFMRLRDLVTRETYGKITSFRATFAQGEVFGPKRGWMFNKKLSGGGVLMNPAPHLFSVIHSLFGVPKKITGTLESYFVHELDDSAELKLSYETFSGSVSLSWCVPHKPISETEIVVECESAVLRANGKRLQVKRVDNTEVIEQFDSIQPFISNTFDVNPEANGEAYYIEDRLFINAVKHKLFIHPAPNDLYNALQTESIIHTCYQSIPITYVKKS